MVDSGTPARRVVPFEDLRHISNISGGKGEGRDVACGRLRPRARHVPPGVLVASSLLRPVIIDNVNSRASTRADDRRRRRARALTTHLPKVDAESRQQPDRARGRCSRSSRRAPRSCGCSRPSPWSSAPRWRRRRPPPQIVLRSAIFLIRKGASRPRPGPRRGRPSPRALGETAAAPDRALGEKGLAPPESWARASAREVGALGAGPRRTETRLASRARARRHKPR